jgi:N-methylhydantoinase A
MNSIDVDTGGTFTDGVIRYEGKIVTTKVDTTPHNPVRCFVECIESGARLLGRDVPGLLENTNVIRYSTTAATNAIIQRKGAKIGLLVTEGAEKTLYEMGLRSSPIWPLLEERLVRGVPEEVDNGGLVQKALDGEEFRRKAEELLDAGARLLVVAFSNAAINPANELRARELFRQCFPDHYLGTPFLILSHQVSSRGGNAKRLNSAVISGYLHRQLVSYLYKCDDAVRSRGYRHPLLVVHSSGGLARVAKTKALHTYNSGPTAGVYGASNITKRYSLPHVLTMDIGGTSTDVAFIENGKVRLSFDVEIEGIPVNLPMIDVLGLGGGGGSLAQVENGTLRVGPDSAGAVPGPACYELGNMQPTVTDADLTLGLIDPSNFLGGKRRVSLEKARQALETNIAKPLSKSTEKAGLMVREVLAASLAGSIRAEAKKRNFPLVSAVLFAYGGAGPLHAADIAARIGVKTFFVFPESPVFSAAGCSSMNIEHLYEQRIRPAEGQDFVQVLQTNVHNLTLRAQRDIRGEGFDPASAKVRAVVERPDGSSIELEAQAVAANKEVAGLKDAILRVTATLDRTHTEQNILSSGSPAVRAATPRDVTWEQGSELTPVWSFRGLEIGKKVSGPCLIESGETTCVVPHGWSVEKDKYGAIRVQKG